MATNLKQIEEMFHRVMEVAPAARAGYLEEACVDDADLRREVDSLISAYESSGGILEDSAVTLAMRVLGAEDAVSMVGQEVGPYKILSLLGQGGMGAVYLAENRRVNKKVALKFLSAEYITDSWAKRQLIKEAQAVAMLDHPNICAVYDFEEIGEHSFIVMQYIEGQTLADLIRNQSLKVNQIVPLAQQIVNALADAHAHGIIHRDIKPKNIMVTPAEQVKVLDFGLAKTIQKNLEDSTESISQLSRDGLLIGTVAYMSPEQLRAERLDYRSDIFSLGTVLYEMVSGKNPFAHKPDAKSKSNAEVISSIMADEPLSLRQISTKCPREFEHVVRKCLEKDRSARYQSAAELLIDLDNLQKGVALPREGSFINLRMAAIAAAVLLAIVVGAYLVIASRTHRQSLALLPITCDEATIPAQCTGPALTEALAKTLSRRSGLRIEQSAVAASPSGPQAASPQRIGKNLDADVTMSGRITRGEKGPLLTIRLERVSDGLKIAEDSEPVNPDELPVLAQWVAMKAVFQLQLPMSDDDRSVFLALAAKRNQNASAVELYIRGRSHWNTHDGEDIQLAIDNFMQATQVDPTFSKAYAGIADSYVLMNTVRYGMLSSKDSMNKADWAAKQALSLDENSAEAHNAYGSVLMKGKWDWEGAEREFKRAIALNPDYSPAHWNYSNLLLYTGRTSEAIVESKVAMDREPFSPPAILNYCKGFAYTRQFDQADACFSKLSGDYPAFSSARYIHGLIYIGQGRLQEATQVFEDFYNKDKARGGAMLGFCYGLTNRRDEAFRVLAEMEQKSAQKPIPPQEFAIVYLGLNDLDHAMPLFQKAIDERYPPAMGIFSDPLMDRFRSDPRFSEMAREVKLPLGPVTSAPASAANVSAK